MPPIVETLQNLPWPGVVVRAGAEARLAALRAAARLLPAPRPLTLLGPDSALRLCDTLAQMGWRRPLVVTDEALRTLGLLDPLLRRLKRQGVDPTVFSGVCPDPTFAVVEAGLAQFHDDECDVVLAVGGGSSIDAAKVIALAAANPGSPRALVGILKARQASRPLFVIPTTAGTGSEVTVGAVISDDRTHQKGLVIDTKVVPMATALDPRLMRGLPARVTADTGLDALTHALEAWMSRFATAETDQFAGAAARLIFEHLPTAWHDGADLRAREALALASHYAGLALNQAGLGYVHAIAHQLGALYGVSHGRANAIVLPHVLRFNVDVATNRLGALARLCGLADDQETDSMAAHALLDRVEWLLRTLGIERHVDGLRMDDHARILQGAFREAHGTYAVPRYMSEADGRRVLEALANS